MRNRVMSGAVVIACVWLSGAFAGRGAWLPSGLAFVLAVVLSSWLNRGAA
jgi:hypothetical protein